MIKFVVTGDTQHTDSFLRSVSKLNILQIMDSCGQQGVDALSLMTPTDTGLAAGSWSYRTIIEGDVCTIYWTNSDVESNFPVAIMLQYGYSTGTGGYVRGRDYIHPAIDPIFDMIAERVWKAVTSS